MLREHREQIALSFTHAVGQIAADADFEMPEIVLERPRQDSHGDLACNVAMQLARPFKSKPRDIAEKIVAQLSQDKAGGLIESLEVAGPGFINIRLNNDAKRAVIALVNKQGEAFGTNDSGGSRHVLVEFVSANPTGPLHVGHGRQAALGDSLAALLQANGWSVHREFYYNDAGAQIENLALSVQARAKGIEPQDDRFPADGYRGEYVADIASRFLAADAVTAADIGEVTASTDVEDLVAIRQFAVACLRHEQDIDLRAFGVGFDRYYLESSLYEDGRVDDVVGSLVQAGRTFESENALWLRTTDYGDDKDRVMRKSDGGYTYFVPDVAYHVTKWERNFHKVINVQGSDHHGTIARVRAGLQALDIDIPSGYPDYVLHKMVTVMRGGQEVKISKRAGSYVTLRDLIEWSGGGDTKEQLQRGRDAVRFFLVSRKADTEFVFDVDLALANSEENPVYYVQYAHARICKVLADDREPGESEQAQRDRIAAASLSALESKHEFALMASMAAWPDVVSNAADELAPHSVAFYLRDLASQLHSYYNSDDRWLVEDRSVRHARLQLLFAVRQIIVNGLTLLGVSAPDRL